MAALDSAGTYAHWLFNGNGSDSSGNARVINMSSGPFVAGLNDQAWNVAGAQYAYCVASGVGTTLGLASSLTIDVVCFPTNVQFPGQAIVDAHMFAIRPTAPDVNWWLAFGLDQTTRNWWWGHTYNTGAAVWVRRNTGSKPLWGFWNIVTYRRKPDPGHPGKLIITVFHNGVKIDEVDNVTPPDGANPNGTAFWVNYNASLQGGEFGGLYDEFRIKTTAETDATILAYHATVGAMNPPYGTAVNLTSVDASDGVSIKFLFDQQVNGLVSVTPPPGGLGWTTGPLTSQPTSNEVDVVVSDVSTASNPAVVGIVVSSNKLTVTFDRDFDFTTDGLNSANWRIAASGGAVGVIVYSVSKSASATLVVDTSEMTTGGAYVLAGATGLVANGGYVNTPISSAFVGVGAKPNILLAEGISQTQVRVTFDEPVNVADALRPSNYSILPALAIDSVQSVSSTVFVLNVARMAAGVTYTVTVSNVRDLAGNAI